MISWKKKKTEEETNANYSFPTPCYEQLITSEIMHFILFMLHFRRAWSQTVCINWNTFYVHPRPIADDCKQDDE